MKARKSFQMFVDTIIKKVAILSKLTVLRLSSYFFKNQNKSCFILESFIIIL